jgi:MFS family permease
VPVVIGLVSMTLAWGTIGAFLPIFAKEALGLPSAQVGYLLAIQSVFNASSRPIAGGLVDRARRRWPIVAIGVTGWAVASVVLGHLTGFWLPAIVVALGTPFMATAFVAAGVVFGDLSSASTRGVTMGVYGTILFLGLALGPLVFGPAVQGYGYAAGFTACAVVSVLLVLVMAAIQSGLLQRRKAQEPVGDSGTRSEAIRRA